MREGWVWSSCGRGGDVQNASDLLWNLAMCMVYQRGWK